MVAALDYGDLHVEETSEPVDERLRLRSFGVQYPIMHGLVQLSARFVLPCEPRVNFCYGSMRTTGRPDLSHSIRLILASPPPKLGFYDGSTWHSMTLVNRPGLPGARRVVCSTDVPEGFFGRDRPAIDKE